MWFECEQQFLSGGALRDIPKDGCEGDYFVGLKYCNLLVLIYPKMLSKSFDYLYLYSSKRY